MLRFDSIGMRYSDGTTALKTVSFNIPRGQFCVVLGSSGAGKSTLLRMVNGLVMPTQGQVRVDGVPITAASLKSVRPRIGMVHQQFSLVTRNSVAANVLAGALPALPAWRAYLARFPAAMRARACELVAAVGLQPEHLQRRVSELSGGQQQRVGIARAFMLNPAVLLADEPVASLDPRISRDILSLLRTQAQQHGSTVLCSLHQVDLAREYADRIVALRRGVVLFDGPAAAFDRSVETALYERDAEGTVTPAPQARDAVAQAGGRLVSAGATRTPAPALQMTEA